MIGSSIKVEHFTWQSAQETLVDLRTKVAFQKGIPTAQAFDIYDNKAIHFIAYTAEKLPVGCCRLMDNGRISRPFILLEWQMMNIEMNLVSAAIEYAKTMTSLTELSILEDARIAPCYMHLGFEPEGSPITEYGLPAQMMKFTLPTESVETASESPHEAQPTTNTNTAPISGTATVSNSATIPEIVIDDAIASFQDKLSYLKALLRITSHCKRRIRIYSPTLPAEIFGNKQLLTLISAHCRRSRFTEVQVLIIDEKPMVTGTHELKNLYEKIPSSISIRKLVPADDEIDYREYMISDDGHMTIRSREKTINGELTANRAYIAKQITNFDEAWGKSRTIADLRLTTY